MLLRLFKNCIVWQVLKRKQIYIALSNLNVYEKKLQQEVNLFDTKKSKIKEIKTTYK
ncbi:hypothetical protein psyc5s11_28270 [Clostridium gelidum]|uniref:Uncharacterized protein n=1 Tax=Clostridium gelidum TaxID=704125 RepID=A0ABM7T4E8_9CLOT|nr:hypothetical protein psyc5s11_28270 [Clostridium gelidum]